MGPTGQCRGQNKKHAQRARHDLLAWLFGVFRLIDPVIGLLVCLLRQAAKKAGILSLYLAAIGTGMRQSELLGLPWANVDLEHGVVSVKQQLIKGGLEPEFGPPKSKRRRKVPIPIPPVLTAALRQDYAKEEEQRSLYGDQYRDYDLVWHVAGGGPYNQRNVSRRFRSLLRQTGLPEDVRFHGLRHTCATLLMGTDINPALVRDLLGHSDIRTTMGYSHTDKTLPRQAADTMQRFLEDAEKDE